MTEQPVRSLCWPTDPDYLDGRTVSNRTGTHVVHVEIPATTKAPHTSPVPANRQAVRSRDTAAAGSRTGSQQAAGTHLQRRRVTDAKL